ncbi:hypothetical protein DYBT9623_04078 [Dyadobacter sp. CECT 9623]|uniref:Secreted protein n=1 Tax=Dyadobacter linearis TaxID=2823330 RepID=A0ABM8UV15_9BACT|nr:hypothetical protein DYBT9623_04078 [Dyadobacter sp. CECT 9623]
MAKVVSAFVRVAIIYSLLPRNSGLMHSNNMRVYFDLIMDKFASNSYLKALNNFIVISHFVNFLIIINQTNIEETLHSKS